MVGAPIKPICILMSIYFTSSCALDENSTKEVPCFEVTEKEVADLDYVWLLSNTDWYFPIQSKLDLYRTSWDILQKSPSEITETEMKSACIRALWEGFSPSILGFDRKLTYDFTPIMDNIFIYTASWRDGDGGKMYLTKTDNKSYIVFLKCWDDGQMSWNVMSTLKALEPSTKIEIVDYIKSLGFNESNFVEEDYSNCNLQKEKSEL